MPLFDFHIHTHFSSCCKFDYGYPDVAKKIQEIGLDGFGVSDHSNYPTYDASFIQVHKNQQHELGLERKGLVGFEISIYDKNGRLGVKPELLKQVDYYIIAEHVHIAKPLSGFFTFKARMLKYFQQYPDTESKINQELDKLLAMELKAIRQNPRQILAHILRFPVNFHFISPKVFEMADKIFDALEASPMVLELHSNFVSGFMKPDDPADKKKSIGGATTQEFYRHLVHQMKNYTFKCSLGSDAHNLAHLHSKNEWATFLSTAGIPESRLVTPEYFEH